MGSISTAKYQARSIGEAINGSSSYVQTLGTMGSDPHPERLLAVGLAHAQNAIAELISLVDDLQDEVEKLKRRR
ncbi:hypothetical protein [Microbacterium arborescens]|uniref:hypothetical protein n=1 Tax=Microbacterium arborescens TaxID=33883 RepID=UPI002783988D|nr:hypothetical protein [Microbacterium arborescens]MDQ1217992.1 hypothetical protein [Microbacterium arborescens]